MQKAVLKLDLHDNKCKKKAMKIASGFAGVESISMEMKDQKLTVTGDMDPVELAEKLRKLFCTEIVSVGPAKEAQKKDDKKDEKKDDKKDDKPSKDPIFDPARGYPFPYWYCQPLPYYDGRIVCAPPTPCCYGGYVSVEEDPNGCVIC